MGLPWAGLLTATLLSVAGAALAADMPTSENSGAANYRRPVPPELVQKQLDSKRRIDAQLQADALRKAQAEQEAKARAASTPPPSRQPEAAPLPGYMYR